MFLQVFVCPRGGGGGVGGWGAISAYIAGGIPACLAAEGSPPGGVPGPGGVAFCCGLLLWPSGLVAFWYGLLGGEGEGHNRRPPHQKATTERGLPGGDPPPPPPTPGWLLLRAVRILLGCILVALTFFSFLQLSRERSKGTKVP